MDVAHSVHGVSVRLTHERRCHIVDMCSALARDMLALPVRNVWMDYDDEADVLYISFRKPQRATKTVEVDEDILVRQDGRTVVGVTIMNASTHRGGFRARAC